MSALHLNHKLPFNTIFKYFDQKPDQPNGNCTYPIQPFQHFIKVLKSTINEFSDSELLKYEKYLKQIEDIRKGRGKSCKISDLDRELLEQFTSIQNTYKQSNPIGSLSGTPVITAERFKEYLWRDNIESDKSLFLILAASGPDHYIPWRSPISQAADDGLGEMIYYDLWNYVTINYGYYKNLLSSDSDSKLSYCLNFDHLDISSKLKYNLNRFDRCFPSGHDGQHYRRTSELYRSWSSAYLKSKEESKNSDSDQKLSAWNFYKDVCKTIFKIIYKIDMFEKYAQKLRGEEVTGISLKRLSMGLYYNVYELDIDGYLFDE